MINNFFIIKKNTGENSMQLSYSTRSAGRAVRIAHKMQHGGQKSHENSFEYSVILY